MKLNYYYRNRVTVNRTMTLLKRITTKYKKHQLVFTTDKKIFGFGVAILFILFNHFRDHHAEFENFGTFLT